MTNLTPVSSLDSVVQNETTTMVLGGPGGPMNLQAQSLLNRTEYLNDARIAQASAIASLQQFDTDLGDGSAPTKGAGKVAFTYATVYAAGSIGKWLRDLATSAGSTFIGFIHTGTGTVLRTISSKLAETRSIEDFGAVGDGVTNDQSAFDAARNWAFNRLPLPSEIVFTRDKYLITQSPNWCVSNIKLTTVGRPEIALTAGSAASASALLIDGQALVPGKAYYGIDIGDFRVKGNSGTLAIVKLRNISHFKHGHIQAYEGSSVAGAAFDLGWSVCAVLELLTCSTNETPMVNVPLRGLYLQSSAGLPCTDLTISQQIMEGPVLGTQIATNGGEFCNFTGTNEVCSDTGITIGPGNKGNEFLNQALEANGSFDIVDQGTDTRWRGGYSTKRVQFSVANGCEVYGMRTQIIDVSSDSVRSKVERCIVSAFAPAGGLVDNSTTTIKTDIWNANTLAYQVRPDFGPNPVTTIAAISVGVSPFTHTNSTRYPYQVLVVGGTVTLIRIVRPGSTTTTVGGGGTGLPVSGFFYLSALDGLEITYTVAPTLTMFPQ